MVSQIFNKYYSEVLVNHATFKYLIYWGITILFSYLLYILYEHPISTFGNKLLHTTKMMYKRIGLTTNNKTN